MATEIKIGSKVRITAEGGPEMTVIDVNNSTKQATCIWYVVAKGVFDYRDFPFEALIIMI